MATVKELVLRLAAEQPGLGNDEIAAQVRRLLPDRRTSGRAVATIKSRAKQAHAKGRTTAQLRVWVLGKRLRALRLARGLSRAELANRAKMSAAGIQRLEASKRASASRADQTNLAKALAVHANVLTGGARLPALGDAPGAARASAVLSPETRLAYDLLERRYRFTDENGRERGVAFKDVVAIAPLLFALAAEASLAWRKAELAELRDALARAQDFVWRSERHRFARDVSQALKWSAHEEDAANRRDLFGDPLPAAHRHQPEVDAVNPFADYLRRLGKDVDEDAARIVGGYAWPFPAYRVCEQDLRRIAGGSALALAALAAGDVRLADVPERLMAEETMDDTAAERARWIEAQASENTRKLAKQRFPLSDG